jgi:hypothetical protein
MPERDKTPQVRPCTQCQDPEGDEYPAAVHLLDVRHDADDPATAQPYLTGTEAPERPTWFGKLLAIRRRLFLELTPALFL